MVWRSNRLSSLEHFRLLRRREGWRLSGQVSLPIENRQGRIDYEVDVDHGWRATGATIRLAARSRSSFLVEVRGDRWLVNSVDRDDLTGCIDLDLGWTPATNTLPIRRLGLVPGQTGGTTVAWLSFPELEFRRVNQRYTNLGDSRWRYESGPSIYQLETTPDGVVERYGDDLWEAVSVS